ncbi:hypothetical protein AGABI1DRAFT_96162 [Agaricus bisporus var. burnettii JB137-S8]|uniref:Uncharacterized protein n=1 Tax=Agaricus bisporus var. burnettii (strain JB137-S8 / ATCC MYA-4627 / FGSC 10392) TaxID=597362 RepID=K5VH69_AGABU|nr:uncharacterized protein AGABI1DRAFT_96162 [Agaricus bisporus var. burnettii JB137-S8]EKM73659.1 hypothetical protein AGABI1DRAFT_96162 [Agaricus bisporus var. burnettii JB137-S8]
MGDCAAMRDGVHGGISHNGHLKVLSTTGVTSHQVIQNSTARSRDMESINVNTCAAVPMRATTSGPGSQITVVLYRGLGIRKGDLSPALVHALREAVKVCWEDTVRLAEKGGIEGKIGGVIMNDFHKSYIKGGVVEEDHATVRWYGIRTGQAKEFGAMHVPRGGKDATQFGGKGQRKTHEGTDITKLDVGIRIVLV